MFILLMLKIGGRLEVLAVVRILHALASSSGRQKISPRECDRLIDSTSLCLSGRVHNLALTECSHHYRQLANYPIKIS